MKVIYNKYIPFKGFVAINLFGILFVREDKKEVFIQNQKVIENHELIHTAQMKELLYIGFYVLYGLNYIVNLFRFFNAKKAYKNILFEKEAYYYERFFPYRAYREHFSWVKFIYDL